MKTEEVFGRAIQRQFCAAIESLRRAINMCPADIWEGRGERMQFWYVVHHTVFWLDFYLTMDPENYRPLAPFGLEELDPAGVIPETIYTKEQLLGWLDHGEQKCRAFFEGMTAERAAKRYQSGWMDFSVIELQLYNMRHVQHHTAQLNLMLRERVNDAPRWVGFVD